ncbi:MAG: hypothetical protein AAFX93_03740 [Verrucomicrobiota bacterium]
MSLINDALKKAQREREQGTVPGRQSLPSMAGAQAKRGNPAQKTSFKFMQAFMAGALVVAVLAGAVGLLITILNKPAEVPPERPTEVAVTIKPTQEQLDASKANPPPSTTERPSSAAERLATNVTPAQPVPTPTPPAAQTPPTPEPQPAPVVAQAAPIPAPKPAPTVSTSTVQAPPVVEAAEPIVATKALEPVAPTTPSATSTGPASEPATPVSAASTSTAPPPSQTVTTPDPEPTPIASAPTPDPKPVTIPPPIASINAEPGATPKPSPSLPQMPSQPVSSGNTDDASPVTPAADAAPNPNIIAFLEASRITGIKVAGSKSRVLMNNQVFKVGSIVEANSQLKITAIETNEIQFVDESGIEYRKQFQR